MEPLPRMKNYTNYRLGSRELPYSWKLWRITNLHSLVFLKTLLLKIIVDTFTNVYYVKSIH